MVSLDVGREIVLHTSRIITNTEGEEERRAGVGGVVHVRPRKRPEFKQQHRRS